MRFFSPRKLKPKKKLIINLRVTMLSLLLLLATINKIMNIFFHNVNVNSHARVVQNKIESHLFFFGFIYFNVINEQWTLLFNNKLSTLMSKTNMLNLFV